MTLPKDFLIVFDNDILQKHQGDIRIDYDIVIDLDKEKVKSESKRKRKYFDILKDLVIAQLIEDSPYVSDDKWLYNHLHDIFIGVPGQIYIDVGETSM